MPTVQSTAHEGARHSGSPVKPQRYDKHADSRRGAMNVAT